MTFRSPYPDVIIPESSFSDYVFEHVSQWGDAPAFIDGPSGRMLTFTEVADGARRVASSLAKRGWHKGDVLAMYFPNLPEYPLAVHGAMLLGGLVGAVPIDGSIQQAVTARLHVPVVQGYGRTETSLAIALTPTDAAMLKAGAAGVLIPNLEGKVIDPVSGSELGVHERGELLVRGPNIMRGYLNNTDTTTLTIEPDGWLHTGDIVSVDEEGYIFVVDRLKELIKYKGMQVAPAELEGVLLTHPAIADAAGIGIPDAEAGEVPKAFVVLKTAVTPEAPMQYVAGKVAPHKRIRQAEIVEAIPKSASGKILRRVLVERELAKHSGSNLAGSARPGGR